jgi:8-oxo-dGTP diphosphatase
MTLVVAAAVVERAGRFLVTRRQKGVHLEGFWEFPGGKIEEGESLDDCLRRELREELGVDAIIGPEIFRTRHAYPERVVELHFLRAVLRGEPAPRLGQELRWAAREELGSLAFPPADAELIAQLMTGGTRQA